MQFFYMFISCVIFLDERNINNLRILFLDQLYPTVEAVINDRCWEKNSYSLIR